MQFIVFSALLLLANAIVAQTSSSYQRLVKIVVDSTQLDAYKMALKEGTTASVRTEVGVLSYQIYTEKDRPNHFTLLETYASIAAYHQHIQTPHFQKYKATVANMVLSLEIVDVLPLAYVVKKKKKVKI